MSNKQFTWLLIGAALGIFATCAYKKMYGERG